MSDIITYVIIYVSILCGLIAALIAMKPTPFAIGFGVIAMLILIFSTIHVIVKEASDI